MHFCLTLSIKHSICCSIYRISSWITINMAASWSSVKVLLQPIVVDLIKKKKILLNCQSKYIQIHTHVQQRKKKRSWFMWNLKKFLTSAARWKSTSSNISFTYLQTYSIIYKHILNKFKLSCRKIAKKRNGDENMWKKY